MAMPTRLPVLLQTRKSAKAGSVVTTANSRAGTAARRTERRKRRGAEKANAVTGRRFRWWGLSRGPLRAVNDDGAEVVHVGVGGAGLEKAARTREKAGGIVVGEKGGRIETAGFGLRGGVAVDDGAGGVGGGAGAAVGAVGIGGERRDPRHAGELDGQRQRIFLVGTAPAAAADGHGELAARQDHGAPAGGPQIAREPRMRGGDLARLALDAVAERDHLVADGLGGGLGRAQGVRRPRRQDEARIGEDLVARLRRLVGGVGERPGDR